MSEADLIERAERAEERARTAEDILRRVFPDLENLRAENVLLRSTVARLRHLLKHIAEMPPSLSSELAIEMAAEPDKWKPSESELRPFLSVKK